MSGWVSEWREAGGRRREDAADGLKYGESTSPAHRCGEQTSSEIWEIHEVDRLAKKGATKV